MNAPFERVVLLEASGAKHLVNLDRETVKIPSVGVVRTDTLQGLLGRRWTIGDRTFLVMVPSIRDEIESVRREAQIIGTKDAPALLWNCDVKPGDFVVEIGAGSGALTLALAHAVGSKGRVVTLRKSTFVEIRSVEIIEREIVAHEAGTHPSFAPLGHTGYLTFARKVLDTF